MVESIRNCLNKSKLVLSDLIGWSWWSYSRSVTLARLQLQFFKNLNLHANCINLNKNYVLWSRSIPKRGRFRRPNLQPKSPLYPLMGQCHKIFNLYFFYSQDSVPGPHMNRREQFRELFRFRDDTGTQLHTDTVRKFHVRLND